MEEPLARVDDRRKPHKPLELGADLVFPDLHPDDRDGFRARIAEATRDPERFYSSEPADGRLILKDGFLEGPSRHPSGFVENDTIHARFVEAKPNGRAVLILRHWNATDASYGALAKVLNRLGFSTCLMTLPYHGRRSIDRTGVANAFLSPNIGRTIRSVQQAVSDARQIVDWLEQRGCESVHVIGSSLGSSVASLLAIADKRIASSILILSAGDFASVVWTGRATQHIRASLEGSLSLEALQQFWAVLSPSRFWPQLSRADHRMLFLSATHDTVVLPHLTREHLAGLAAHGADFEAKWLPCGHYSMGLVPFSAIALSHIIAFQSRRAASS